MNSQSLNSYSYILNNPLSGTDPTGYSSCSADTDAVDCANGTGAGGTSKVYQQDAGSHIKTAVGSVTNNGDGTATFKNNAGGSMTLGKNGSDTGMGKTGSSAGGRREQSSSTSEKGNVSSEIQVTAGGSGAKREPVGKAIRKAVIDATHVVETLYSNPGETPEAFDWRTRDRIDQLTEATGYEYRSGYAFKDTVNPDGTTMRTEAQTIQTADSAMVSVARYWEKGEGWRLDPTRDQHSHGRTFRGYKYTALDVMYMRQMMGRNDRFVGEIEKRPVASVMWMHSRNRIYSTSIPGWQLQADYLKQKWSTINGSLRRCRGLRHEDDSEN